MTLDPIVSSLHQDLRRDSNRKKSNKTNNHDAKQYTEDEFVRVRLVEYQMLTLSAPEDLNNVYYDAVKPDIFTEFKEKYHHSYKGKYNTQRKKN